MRSPSNKLVPVYVTLPGQYEHNNKLVPVYVTSPGQYEHYNNKLVPVYVTLSGQYEQKLRTHAGACKDINGHQYHNYNLIMVYMSLNGLFTAVLMCLLKYSLSADCYITLACGNSTEHSFSHDAENRIGLCGLVCLYMS